MYLLLSSRIVRIDHGGDGGYGGERTHCIKLWRNATKNYTFTAVRVFRTEWFSRNISIDFMITSVSRVEELRIAYEASAVLGDELSCVVLPISERVHVASLLHHSSSLPSPASGSSAQWDPGLYK